MKEEGRLVAKTNVKCPHCKKNVEVSHMKVVVTKPVPGEYQDKFIVEAGKQSTLDQHEPKKVKK